MGNWKNNFFVFFVLICLINGVFAASSFPLFVYEKKDWRQFAVIEQDNDRFQLQIFEQQRGDFQDLVTTLYFPTIILLKSYLRENYPLMRPGTLDPSFEAPINNEKLPFFGSERNSIRRMKRQPIWSVRHEWNSEWEAKYATWVEKSFDDEFFVRYKISTDCADVAIGLRWIFSRIHFLPAANHLTGSETLFGHFSSRQKWRKLRRHDEWHKDKLFLAALEYVFSNTYTKSLMLDSLPVNIVKGHFRAGSYYIRRGETDGHVRVFSLIDFESDKFPLMTLSSTLPTEIRVMNKELFMNSYWPEESVSGIMAMRWPIKKKGRWKLKSSDKHPHYSLWQYDTHHRRTQNFTLTILWQFGGKININNFIQQGLDDLISYIDARRIIVERGYLFCLENDCSQGSYAYEDWSTPSRDKKLLEKFRLIELYLDLMAVKNSPYHLRFEKLLKQTFVSIEGRQYNFAKIRFALMRKGASFDPSVDIDKRWGVSASFMAQKFKKTTLPLLQSRNEKINNQPWPCVYSCSPPEYSWWDYNSYLEDNQIKAEFDYIRGMCREDNDFFQCQKSVLALLKKSSLRLNGEDWTFASVYKKAPLFGADPRMDRLSRWGDNSRIILLPPIGSSLHANKGGYIFIDKKYLFSIKDQSVLEFSPQEYILSPNGEVWIIKREADKFVINNGKVTILSLPNDDYKTLAIDDSIYLFGKTNYRYDCKNGNLTDLGAENRKFSYLGLDHLFLGQYENQYFLLQGNKGIHIPLFKDKDPSGSMVIQARNQNIIYGYLKLFYGQKYRPIRVDLRTQNVLIGRDTQTEPKWVNDHYFVYSEKLGSKQEQTFLVHRDFPNDLKPIAYQFIDQVSFLRQEVIFSNGEEYGQRERDLLKLNNGQFKMIKNNVEKSFESGGHLYLPNETDASIFRIGPLGDRAIGPRGHLISPLLSAWEEKGDLWSLYMGNSFGDNSRNAAIYHFDHKNSRELIPIATPIRYNAKSIPHFKNHIEKGTLIPLTEFQWGILVREYSINMI